MRKWLPVTWANYHWFQDHNDRIRRGDRIKRNNPKWIDYRKLPEGDTSKLLAEGHPHRPYRLALRNQIISDALSDIDQCKDEAPICIYTCGGTASGKTSAVDLYLTGVNSSSEQYVRIDYDRLKRDLPEYLYMQDAGIKEAALYVHSESAKLAGNLFKKAFPKKVNIIYEKTLAQTEQTIEEIRHMREKGYGIVVIATHSTVDAGLERAEKRFKDGGRYVPPDVIADTYAKVPINLAIIKEYVDALVLFDNTGPALAVALVTYEGDVKFLDEGRYNGYLQRVGEAGRLV